MQNVAEDAAVTPTLLVQSTSVDSSHTPPSQVEGELAPQTPVVRHAFATSGSLRRERRESSVDSLAPHAPCATPCSGGFHTMGSVRSSWRRVEELSTRVAENAAAAEQLRRRGFYSESERSAAAVQADQRALDSLTGGRALPQRAAPRVSRARPVVQRESLPLCTPGGGELRPVAGRADAVLEGMPQETLMRISLMPVQLQQDELNKVVAARRLHLLCSTSQVATLDSLARSWLRRQRANLLQCARILSPLLSSYGRRSICTVWPMFGGMCFVFRRPRGCRRIRATTVAGLLHGSWSTWTYGPARVLLGGVALALRGRGTPWAVPPRVV